MIPKSVLLLKYKEVILDYVDVNNHIDVVVNLPERIIVVNKNAFWKWMKEKGYDSYFYDYYDPSQSDGHGQKSGKITLEDYFEHTGRVERMVDLYEFLAETNRIEYYSKS